MKKYRKKQSFKNLPLNVAPSLSGNVSNDAPSWYGNPDTGFYSEAAQAASNAAAHAVDSYVWQMRRELDEYELQEKDSRSLDRLQNPTVADAWSGTTETMHEAPLQTGVPGAILAGIVDAAQSKGGLWQNIQDNLNSFLSRQANSDYEDAAGAIQRIRQINGDQENGLGYNYKKWLLLGVLEELLLALLEGIASLMREDKTTAKDGYDAFLKIQKLLNDVRNQRNALSKDAKLFESIVSENRYSRVTDDIKQDLGQKDFGRSANGWNGPIDNPFVQWLLGNGSTTPTRDVVKDVSKYMWNFDDETIPLAEKLERFEHAHDESKSVLENLNRILENNRADLNYYESKISKAFIKKRDSAGMDFTDPDTYLYKLSGIMGSSAGSWRSTVANMTTSIAATAAAPATGGLSLLFAAPTLFSLNLGSGTSENNAEVANAVRDKFVEKIGGIDSSKYKKIVLAAKEQLYPNGVPEGVVLTNELLIEEYLSGNIKLNDKDIQNAAIDSSRAIDSLFRHDMVATTADSAIDTILMLTPVGPVLKLGKLFPVKYLRVNAKLATRGFRNSQLGRNIIKRAEDMAVAGGTVGVAGYGAGTAVGAALGAAETGLKKVSTVIGGTALGELGEKTLAKINRARNFLGRAVTPKRLREVTKDMYRSPKGLTTRKFVKDYSGKVILSKISEGIEEGKQHQYAEDFKHDILDEDPTFAQILVDDLGNGLDIAYDIARIPLDGHFGISIKDQDRLAEIKGGILAFQPTSVVNVVQNAKPYVQELRAEDVIMNNMIADKTEALDLFEKNRAYMRNGLFEPGRQAYNKGFDSVRKYNLEYFERNGRYIISPELIDAEQKRMGYVLSLANDKETKQEAKSQGIKPKASNKEFLDFVALKSEAWRHYDEEIDKYNAIVEDAKVGIQRTKDDYVQTVKLHHFEGEGQDEGDVSANQTAASRNARNELLIRDKVAYSDVLARIDALLAIKKQLDRVNEFYLKYPNVKNGTLKYYKRIDDELKKLLETAGKMAAVYTTADFGAIGELSLHDGSAINTSEDVSKMVVDHSLHDLLRSVYEQLYKQYQNVLNAQESVEEVVGKKDDVTREITKKGNAKSIIKRIDETKKSDDEFYNTLFSHIANEEEKRQLSELGKSVGDSEKQINPNENSYNPAEFEEQGQDEYVYDDDGNPVTVRVDKDGNPVDEIPEGHYVDEEGFLIKKGLSIKHTFSVTPVFGEWDDNGKRAAKEDFDGVIRGVHLAVNPNEFDDDSLWEIFDQIDRQQKEKEKTEAAANKSKKKSDRAEEYLDWGDATLAPNHNAMTIDELIAYKKEERRRIDNTSDVIGVPTDYTWNGKRVFKCTNNHTSHAGEYYVFEHDFDGWYRNFNIDKDGWSRIEHTTDFVMISGGLLITATRPEPIQNKKQLPAVIYNPLFGRKEEPSPQQLTLERLAEKARWDAEHVIKQKDKSNVAGKYDTTSRSYFIRTDDGKVIRYHRVHALLIDSYEKKEQNAAIQKYLNELRKFNNVKDIIAYLTEHQDSAPHDIEVYKTYLHDNEGLFNNDLTTREVQDTLEDIAHILGLNAAGVSVTVGNVVDELTRYFFSSQTVYERFRNDKEQAITELGEMTPEFDQSRVYSSWFKNREALSTFIDLLIAIKENFDQLGWAISSTPYTWNAEFTDAGRVAGETDLIAVDKTGSIHVIDIKTSYKGFDTNNVLNYSATQDATEKLTADDVLNNTAAARKLKKELSDKYHNRITFKVQGGTIVAYNRVNAFYDITNQQYGQKRSNYDYYTDQQNAYAAMIMSELNNQVRSMEILPFRVSYDGRNALHTVSYISDITNFKDGEHPKRLMLLSRDLKWNTQSRISQNEIDHVLEVDRLYSRLQDLVLKLDQVNTDLNARIKSALDSIPEVVASYRDRLNSARDLRSVIASSTRSSEFNPYAVTDDFDTLQSDVDTLSDLFNSYDSILNVLNAQNEQDQYWANYSKEYEVYERWLNDNTADNDPALEYGISRDRKLQVFDREAQNKKGTSKYVYITTGFTTKTDSRDGTVIAKILQTRINRADGSVRDSVSNASFELSYSDIDLTFKALLIKDNEQEALEWLKNYTYNPFTDSRNEYTIRCEGFIFLPNGDVFAMIREGDIKENVKLSSTAATKYRNIVIGNNGSDVYANSKTHTGQYGRTLLYYKHVLNDPELTQATTAPDFVTDAKIYVGDRSDGLYCDIEYHGKTYKNIWIVTKDKGRETEAGRALWKQYNELKAKLLPGLRIIADPTMITRTKGRIVVHTENGKVVRRSLMATDLVGTEENALYDIEMSKQYGHAGYVNGQHLIVTWGSTDRELTPLDVQVRFGIDAITPGTFVWLKDAKQNENGITQHIPVAVHKKPFSENDIDFIVDLIKNPDKRNDTLKTEAGRDTKISYKSLLNLMFPIAEDTRQVLEGSGDMLKLQFLGANNSAEGAAYSSKVALRNTTSVSTNQLNPNDVFDLTNRDDERRFRERLKTLTIPEQHSVMGARLGMNEDNKLPFKAIRDYFINSIKDGRSVTNLTISVNGKPTSLVFDTADFATKTGPSGATRYGLSGLGWYVKHNMFETEYDHIGSANVEIKGLTIYDPKLTVDLNGMGAEEMLNPSDIDVLDGGYAEASFDDVDDDWGFYKVIPLDTKPKKRINATTAKERLAKIFGKDWVAKHVTIDSKILGIATDVVTNKKGALVGNCIADALLLSEQAPDGIEWHEAFHRVLELLTDEAERTSIYKIIAHLNNITYSKDDTTLKILAEHAADAYMNYMNGSWQPTNRVLQLIAKVYNKIRDWVHLWLPFYHNARGLYKMYARVNNGHYKDITPSSTNIARFERLFPDGAHYTIHGENFEHIVNGAMYDVLKQSVLFTILKGTKVDPTGGNITELGRAINKETFRKGVDVLLKQTNAFDMLGEKTSNPSVGQIAMKEIYEHFDNDNIRQDIANTLLLIATDYVTKQEEVDRDAMEDGQVTSADPSDHTRDAFEFAPFTKTTSRVRFFFATIPELAWGEKIVKHKTADGKIETKRVKVAVTKLNDLGLPLFAPVGYVFNDVLSTLCECDSDAEFFHAIENAAKSNPTYQVLGKRLKQIYNASGKDPDAEALWAQLRTQVQNHKGTFEIAKAIKVNNNSPFGLYTIQMQKTDTDYNAKHYPLQWGSMLANGGTPIIKIDQQGRHVINPNNPRLATLFKNIHDMFDSSKDDGKTENGIRKRIDGLKQWLTNADLSENTVISQFPVKVIDRERSKDGKPKYKTLYLTNPKDDASIQLVKNRIVQALNMLGINMNFDEFEYMLIHKYGSSDYSALSKMVLSNDITDSMTSFLDFLNNAVNKDGLLNLNLKGEIILDGNATKLDQVYTNMAFVKSLANWKYEYRHAHDQLMVLATNNNKYYTIFENNYLTDVARDFNKRGAEYQRLTSGQDPYTYMEEQAIADAEGNVVGTSDYTGSYVLHEMKKDDATGNKRKIGFINIAGFKTDKRGDYGADYFQMQLIEDVIMKMAILQNGDILSPTRSDKKAYSVLRGIRLPGFDYRRSKSSNGNVIANDTYGALDIKLLLKDSATQKTMLQLHNDVLDVFLRYALSEYNSVKAADLRLDKMQANKEVDTQSLVENYYTKEQGAKFALLLGVYVPVYDKDGNVTGERYVSFNNNKRSRKENIKIAEDYFFEPKVFDDKGNVVGTMQFESTEALRDYLKTLLARNLMAVCDKELENLVNLGLIEKTGNDPIDYFNYKNVGLDAVAIESIYKSISLPEGEQDDANKQARRQSLALCLYVNDISNKASMSGIEFEKLFAGNPAFYKWRYDSDGNLVDRTVDELKRAGGEGSTGKNNYIELKNIPSKYIDKNTGTFTGKYVCAEIKNEEITSPLYDMISKTMELSMIRQSAMNKRVDNTIREYEDRMSIIPVKKRPSKELQLKAEANLREDAEKYIDGLSEAEVIKELTEDELNIAKARAKLASDSYSKGIDVADGAAYITDTMCEMLLRQLGIYSKSILNAFEILRSKSDSDILKKASAYLKVVTTVIGTQKYTAFGRRIDPNTGLLTVYYNKYALFPLFECMTTGRMSDIYHAMQNLGVDVCLIQSAVKVGSQGAQDIEWSNYRLNEDELDKPMFDDKDNGFKFNTYEQDFKYLRKQLNTDPNEKKYMNIGTQATKIVFSNLITSRKYKMRNGVELSGQAILDNVMESMNELSDIGMSELDESFYSVVKGDDGSVSIKTPDAKKFVNELKSMLSDDDPNRNLIESLETTKVDHSDGTFHYEISVAPDAVLSSNWLESKLISRINSKVIDTETPGAAFIQRSVWNMERTQNYSPKTGGVLTDENLPKTINGGKPLLMVNEEGSMDCVLSIDYFIKLFKDPKTGRSFNTYEAKDANGKVIRDYVLDENGEKIPVYERDPETGKYKLDENGEKIQKRDKNGNLIYKKLPRYLTMSFADARAWLINRGIIGSPRTSKDGTKIPGAKANIMAYRIPTQALASIHALRCVDVLPVVNDTVILPAEFTKITGSDFKQILKSLNFFNCWKTLTNKTRAISSQVSTVYVSRERFND